MYSLLIELFNEKEKHHFTVFDKKGLNVEDCIKQALRWRIRPYQKFIKKIYIFIEPTPIETNDIYSLSSSSSSYSNMTTQSTLVSQILKEDDTEFPTGIKKKISFACYGKFVSFLKSYCLKNDKGSFKIVFVVEDTTTNLFEQLTLYQKKIKKKLLSYNIGINEVTEENKLLCETIIGLGAFGVVYKSNKIPKIQQRTLKKTIDTCAIKVIPLLTISNVSSVYREIYILNMMSSYDKLNPYVVNYYGSFVDDEYLYVVMEYLQGPSLNHFITAGSDKYSILDCKNRKEHVNELFLISHHLSKALQSIHEIGVVHRDLKPGNIMFDGQNNFKIVDFGFAALVPKSNIDEILKWDNKVVGTYRFSPPEVLSFADDINWLYSDYWSMGTVIYFVATGKQFLERSSKDRIEMLNILHKRLDTIKPLKIPFFNVFFNPDKLVSNKSKIKSASAPAVCNNSFLSMIKCKTSYEMNGISKSKEQLETLIRGLLEYLPENRVITNL